MTTEAISKPYQGAYRTTLEEPVTQEDETTSAGTTSDTDPDTAEERSWKKRYGDLRSYNSSLTQKVKQLETQLQAASKKEIQIPSTKEEIEDFARRYPDVFRHIRSIALSEFLNQKKELEQETQVVKERLEDLNREAAEKKIKQTHSDFDELNASEEFHTWANAQPRSIQQMLYESADPDDCIAAIDLFKAHNRKKPGPKPRSDGADTLVNRTKLSHDVTDEGGKRIWKDSDIRRMHPKQYEQLEAEIEAARREGRIDPNS